VHARSQRSCRHPRTADLWCNWRAFRLEDRKRRGRTTHYECVPERTALVNARPDLGSRSVLMVVIIGC